MNIPGEQTFVIDGAELVVPLNTDYAYTQITLGGRDTGTVIASARPLLEKNGADDFEPEEFEMIEGGDIDLAATPRQRTFTIENKRLSAVHFADDGVGEVKGYVRQWSRVTN